ncbi:MAG TPA: carbohydrate ABC transporter permease [Anaerolineae bacterium]
MNGAHTVRPLFTVGQRAAAWPAIRRRLGNIMLYTLVVLGGLAMFVPLAWVLLTSVKMPEEVTRIPITWLPDRAFYFDNYVELFKVQPFARYFVNSLWVSVLSLVSSGIIATLAAYAFAKLKFPLKEFWFILVLAVFMVPLEAVVLPMYLIVAKLDLVNRYLGLALPNLFTAFGVYLLRQFMEGIPDDYIDAARIDGASELKILWQIVTPLITPALASFVIIKFMWSWNEFLWPIIVGQQQSMFTVTVGLVNFAGVYYTNWTLITTATVFSMLPMILIFIFLQRYLVQGLVLSGIKG